MESNLKDVILHQLLGAPAAPRNDRNEQADGRAIASGDCLVLLPARTELRLSRPRRRRAAGDVLMIC